MNEIMLDLETMGTGPDAAILAIGAVELNRETGQLGREFYEVVDLVSAIAAGGTVDASTILWWMQQSDEARGEFKRGGRHIIDVLQSFTHWVRRGAGAFNIWGNGSDFDNVILRSAYSRLSMQVPWSHRQNRCFRTVRNEYPPVDTSTWESVKHNALSDAKWQARYLIEVLRRKG
jgi:exodeoxyribonuclease VIII